VNGAWLRTPYNTWRIKQASSQSILTIYDRDWLPLPNCGDFKKASGGVDGWYYFDVYWVEIVSTNAYSSDMTSHKTDCFTKYGMFVSYGRDAGDMNEYTKIHQRMFVWPSSPSNFYYPSLNDIMNDVDSTLGIEASSIVSINISRRCPYSYTKGSDGDGYQLRNRTYQTLLPTNAKRIGSTNDWITFYRLDYTPFFNDPANTPAQAGTQISKVMTNDEFNNGILTLLDECQNTIATIDTNYSGTSSDGREFRFWIQTYSDFTGMYTFVMLGEELLFVLNEGHLPYVGSAWETYKAYSMDTDRQAVENAKYIADEQQKMAFLNAGMSAIGTAGSGALAGGPIGLAAGAGVGLMSFGLDAIQSELSKQLTYTKLDMDQALRERRMRQMPGKPYSTTYGLTYCEYAGRFPGATFAMMMPENFNTTQYSRFVGEYGYPTDEIGTKTLKEGRWQGRIFTTATLTGPKMERLNRDLETGIKIIKIV
jgi:hypothetical protein